MKEGHTVRQSIGGGLRYSMAAERKGIEAVGKSIMGEGKDKHEGGEGRHVRG